MITVLWHEGEAAGSTDMLPKGWFTKEGGPECHTHRVRRADESYEKARCDIVVTSQHANLDYEPYVEYNDKHNMQLGTLRLEFEDKSRVKVTQVYWKSNESSRFNSVSATADREPNIPPRGNLNPSTIKSQAVDHARDEEVKEWVLDIAQGRCEGCRSVAPFMTDSDEPFLEVHHIKPLSDGGSDTVSNTVALCPNCHKRCHHSKDRSHFVAQIFSRVERVKPE